MYHTKIFSFLLLFFSISFASAFASESEISLEAFDLEKGKRLYIRKAKCTTCHGWDGAGSGKHPRAYSGPNLREYVKDYEMLVEIISCGRPGSMMPFHDRMAYKDDRCYGLTFDDFEADEVKPKIGKVIRKDDINTLAAYVYKFIIGAGVSTVKQCKEFYGKEHLHCNQPHLK